MADPNTVNIALTIPNRGSNVGVWDTPVNGDFNALDGFLGGVQAIGLSNANVTLTAPAGSIAPSGGPTQAQNLVLRFTGALTGNVVVTLPLPGRYIVENQTTGSNFVLQLAGAVAQTEVIAIQPGACATVYNDGSRVRFVNDAGNGPGKMEFWAGLPSLPLWAGSCTVFPYLLCDGTVYNVSSFPYLGARLGSTFGGNGSTTFAVPDLRGRVPLAFDGTGARITTGGSGLNGQLLGAALDQQTVALSLASLPTGITSSVSVASPNSNYLIAPLTGFGLTAYSANSGAQVWRAFDPGAAVSQINIINSSGSATSNNTGGGGHNNVQPSQVAGIWVIKT